jgi:hypothetical protein
LPAKVFLQKGSAPTADGVEFYSTARTKSPKEAIMSDYKIPGYEVLGDVDITQERYDLAGIAMLVLKEGTTELYVLKATGCGCGSNSWCSCGMYDAMVPENMELVIDLEATARELYDDVVNSDSPDVPALRAMLIVAIERTGYTPPKTALEG